MLVHELKTPLTTIVSASDYLVRNIKEETAFKFFKANQ
jgi:signal transduction histidine kinase